MIKKCVSGDVSSSGFSREIEPIYTILVIQTCTYVCIYRHMHKDTNIHTYIYIARQRFQGNGSQVCGGFSRETVLYWSSSTDWLWDTYGE